MSTPMAPVQTDDVRTYVAAVRARLADLTAEEIEELTGGLEADLAEALAGGDAGPRQRFGDPAAYADELRSAAGLAPRSAGGARSAARQAFAETGNSLRASLRTARDDVTGLPGFERVRDFVVVLRPAWWVLRAWVAYRFLYELLQGRGVFPGGLQGLLVLAVAVVVSVELGRRAPFPEAHWKVLLAVGNVMAVLLLPLMIDVASDPEEIYSGYSAPPAGLARDGEPIYNIFPFDGQGRPLRDVRLYDERGRALLPGESMYYDDEGRTWRLVPRSGLSREQTPNIYPLQREAETYDDNGEQVPSAPQDAPVPFPDVPPLLAAPAPVTATPTPAASVTQTPTPTPTPTITP